MTGPAPRKSRATAARKARKDEIPISESHPPITLITGTDTGVGKTWVGCALARALTAAGQRVVAIKPIETGCGPTRSASEDGVQLAESTGQREPAEALVRLREPVAAAVASELEGVTIDLQSLMDRIRGYSASYDITIVEGAGGLLAPLTWQDNMLDLAHGLGARVLIVGSDRLGTINHTLLTMRVLKAVRVPILGVVLTTPAEPDPSTGSNAEALRRLSGIDLVWSVPHLTESLQAAEALKEVAGWLLP